MPPNRYYFWGFSIGIIFDDFRYYNTDVYSIRMHGRIGIRLFPDDRFTSHSKRSVWLCLIDMYAWVLRTRFQSITAALRSVLADLELTARLVDYDVESTGATA